MGGGSSAGSERRHEDHEMEKQVSEYILGSPISLGYYERRARPESQRAYIERNMISQISNYQKTSIDPRSDDWLGNHSKSKEIRESGLGNANPLKKSTSCDLSTS